MPRRLLLVLAGLLAADSHAQATREAADAIAKARATLAKEADALTKVRNLHFEGKVLDKEGTPILHLDDANGKARAALRLDADSLPSLSLCDGNNRERAVLAVDKLGSATLEFRTERRNPIWRAPSP